MRKKGRLTDSMWIFQAIKLNNVELPIYLDYYDLIQQKKDWRSESLLTEIGLITGNLAQLRSNQQTMRVKICFCVISWYFQAVKTRLAHHFLQVSWSFLGFSSLIFPQQTTLNAAHLITKITAGILAAIKSGLIIMVSHHFRQIRKTLFKLLCF